MKSYPAKFAMLVSVSFLFSPQVFASNLTEIQGTYKILSQSWCYGNARITHEDGNVVATRTCVMERQ